MLKRFAPLVPITLALLLTACASTSQQSTDYVAVQQPSISFELDAEAAAKAQESSIEEQLLDDKPYELPGLSGILFRGFSLIGTPYRFGGTSTATGFDCSGFIGYLFREQAGIKLPRSTREMIAMPAPKVDRHELQPGDLVFFANRGRVNHAGIYIGEGEFIHSSSTRSGGVRVDKLSSDYWNSHYLMAKRVLN